MENNFPLFSIITITKNPDLIWFEKTLESVNSQCFNDYEHIVLDASDDGNFRKLSSLCSSFPKVKVYKQKSLGIWPAFEEAYLLAKGSYVGVINSDDYYNNDEVFKILSEEISSTEPDFLFGNSRRVDKYGCELYIHKPLPFLSKSNFDYFVFNISHHTLFFKRDVLNKYRFNDSSTNAVDLSFMRKLYKSDLSRVYVNKVLACFRIHDNNYSSSYSKDDTKALFSKWTGLPKDLFFIFKFIIFMANISYLKFYLKNRVFKQ